MSPVDVIVPCYNYGRFLRECVRSVLAQEGVGVRVLIIDDASQDDSEQVGKQLAAEDGRVEYRRHAVNRGHIKTYNEGLDWTAGDYTLLVSADDLLVPGALRRACGFLDAHPEVGFVYGKVIRWDSDKDPLPAPPESTEFTTRVIPGRGWIEAICNGDPPTTSPEIVIRTKLHKQMDQFRADLPHWADVEMLMRFAARAPVGYIGCHQAYYRIHGSSMHLYYRGIRELEQRRTAFHSLFGGHGRLIRDGERLKKAAFRHIAEAAVWEAHKAFERNDIPTCQLCTRFARETFPPISSFNVYLHLRCKTAIGRRACGLVSPVWRWLKRGTRIMSLSQRKAPTVHG
jgi:glycosyltransferase involved in cell wall biosynthesis